MVDGATLSPRARRREANLSRILDEAMAMVTSEGFAALSMNKLAGACDYTPGALYRYFDSKDALYSALVDQVLAEIQQALTAAVSAEPAERPFVRLFALTHAYRRFSVDHPNKFGLIAMSMAAPQIILESAQSTDPVVSRIISLLSPIAEALATAMSSGALHEGPVQERTIVFFSAVQGILLLRKQSRVAPDLLDLDRLSTLATRTLLLGWGADSAAVDAALEEARSGGPS